MQWPQANNFFRSFFYFWVLRYNKTLNDWPLGKQWVLFPLDLNVPSASPRGTLSVSGNQNSLFPLWPVIKCLLLFKFYILHDWSNEIPKRLISYLLIAVGPLAIGRNRLVLITPTSWVRSSTTDRSFRILSSEQQKRWTKSNYIFNNWRKN